MILETLGAPNRQGLRINHLQRHSWQVFLKAYERPDKQSQRSRQVLTHLRGRYQLDGRQCSYARSCRVFQNSPYKNSFQEVFGEGYTGLHPYTAMPIQARISVQRPGTRRDRNSCP